MLLAEDTAPARDASDGGRTPVAVLLRPRRRSATVATVVADAVTAATMTAVAVHERGASLTEVVEPDPAQLRMGLLVMSTTHVRFSLFG